MLKNAVTKIEFVQAYQITLDNWNQPLLWPDWLRPFWYVYPEVLATGVVVEGQAIGHVMMSGMSVRLGDWFVRNMEQSSIVHVERRIFDACYDILPDFIISNKDQNPRFF